MPWPQKKDQSWFVKNIPPQKIKRNETDLSVISKEERTFLRNATVYRALLSESRNEDGTLGSISNRQLFRRSGNDATRNPSNINAQRLRVVTVYEIIWGLFKMHTAHRCGGNESVSLAWLLLLLRLLLNSQTTDNMKMIRCVVSLP